MSSEQKKPENKAPEKDFKSYLPTIPSELRLNHKWQSIGEKFLINVTIGTIGCGLASLVLFSKLFASTL